MTYEKFSFGDVAKTIFFGIVTASFLFISAGNVFAIGENQNGNAFQASIVNEKDKPAEAIGTTDIREAVTNAIDFFLGFLGLVMVAYIIYAGFTIVTSQGDEEALTKGRKMIVYGAIGIVIIFLSWTIVNFIASFKEGIEGTGATGA